MPTPRQEFGEDDTGRKCRTEENPTMLDDELFARVIDQALSLDEFKARLQQRRPLRIKYGVDVTAPFLHIGHAVNLWMMRLMQERGHKVVFLIGDFTTRIGDPTGKSQTRPVIPREKIEANAEQFLEQAAHVLLTDPSVFETRRNSEWYDCMPLAEFLGLLSVVTHGRLIARDMFQKRIQNGHEIHMHEMLYPVLQGYDSAMLQADLTIVGTDQLFNEMMGRFYQERAGQPPQVILTTRITMGTDGKNKQSKSLGNHIALADTPRDKFGKLMSILDTLVPEYLEVYTALPSSEVDALKGRMSADPMGVKMAMARAVVARYHGEEQGLAEQEYFQGVFSQRQAPQDMPQVVVTATLTALGLLRAADPETSKSQLRRLLEQNAVELDGRRLTDPNALVQLPSTGSVLKVGKRRWVRVVLRNEGSPST
jgi:tyrosyl-tRNA synthetase